MCRSEGGPISLSLSLKTKRSPPSPWLLVHFHGGGFVAQTSKSHEVSTYSFFSLFPFTSILLSLHYWMYCIWQGLFLIVCHVDTHPGHFSIVVMVFACKSITYFLKLLKCTYSCLRKNLFKPEM